ncbi:MAG: hypothetical protein IPK68_20340 [Bdellovibrionales bacterium]|nr:hypothetical protein [Bdellovibrionales bacterium]
MKIIGFAASAAIAAISILPAKAFAIPFVYSCDLFEYHQKGTTKTEITYNPAAGLEIFNTGLTEARLYLNAQKNLSISLRSLSNPSKYSSVVAYDVPLRISLVNADSGGETSRIDCRL